MTLTWENAFQGLRAQSTKKSRSWVTDTFSSDEHSEEGLHDHFNPKQAEGGGWADSSHRLGLPSAVPKR